MSFSDDCSLVHAYGTKSTDLFPDHFLSLKDELYLGVEIEYVLNARNADSYEYILKGIDSWFRKEGMLHHFCSDGSIDPTYNFSDLDYDDDDCYGGADGVEIITCPYLLEDYISLFPQFFSQFSTQLLINQDTGMHVHVNRSVLDTSTLAKLMVFINHLPNKRQIINLAGRYNDEYADFKSNARLTDVLKSPRTRYEAINLSNENTIEFRIFKSPESFYEFAYRLEFVHAAVNFARQTDIVHLSFNKSFKTFVSNESYLYPNLYNYLCA